MTICWKDLMLKWVNAFHWINYFIILSDLRFATAKAFCERGKASAGKHSRIHAFAHSHINNKL